MEKKRRKEREKAQRKGLKRKKEIRVKERKKDEMIAQDNTIEVCIYTSMKREKKSNKTPQN